MKQCKFAYPWISGKRRHSEVKPDKSQLKEGVFYVILHIIRKLFCLRGKKINQVTIENACASLSSQKTGWHDKKWTKWSNLTLKQQKTTIKTHLIAINAIKCIKIQNQES
ncbi:TPA_asm: hypothetical protein G0K52_11780 [Salmonella enterica subsp. enterica serovar Typhimurium]|uniref:Uncharacterized protein n=1 Tax=Salmonella typhimurium TaxID=90371 RepID=A0A707EF64_SALTM|nr:hypothetical protein [Salmonella enterica subsp. enterica serovar Typhimurium]HAK0707042.1 hypothetical protein [Salmonella enterica]EBX4153963.1 hypothetical protein [Salmonella enterica subsp. enterica serovar Typhimurium]EBY9678045.1 hypothetical protein [Salmonella enterica subsp. enterica serovar Typhimurium]ECF1214627.1 hypothetical protein [Salmonella enterica subsp. enterica serovar Typhimurium]